MCRVLPDVPAVDRAFDYLVPDEVAARVVTGTIVRVPLHGRRVKGWVLEPDVEPEPGVERLLPLRSFVSAGPPADVVALCEWAAWRWAGPRVAFLRAASPPNVVGEAAPNLPDAAVFPVAEAPIELPTGSPRVVRWPPARDRVALVRALVAAEGSTIVVLPDGDESQALAAALGDEGREVVLLRNDTGDAERTAAWAAARRGACVVVGGRVASFAPVPDLAAVVVLDDLDEALEEERAPTWDAPTLLHERARRAGARLEVVSPAPGAAMAASAAVTTAATRDVERAGWARLEVVDVRYEPPGQTLLSARLADALRRTRADGGRALCVLNRRGRARLLVCGSCSEVARCARCDAAVQEGIEGLECSRCGTTAPPVCVHCGSGALRPRRLGVMRVREHLAALVPRTRVVAVEAGSAPIPAFDVAVGTEAVLHRVESDPSRPVRLVAFLDMDQELLAPRFRAEEQALWLLVRAGRQVGERFSGGTVLAQTRMPDHPVLVAARDADPATVLTADLARRRDLGYPPFGGLAELSGDAAAVDAAAAALAAHEALRVLGPSDGRALVRSRRVEVLCDALASTDFGPARGLGRLRVDVDPRRV